jgi:glycosyltransferase involved in cell wall biosynthesis
LILPGIDTARFSYTAPSSNDFVLLVGSAPWIPQQFKQKGIDALLEAASQMTSLRLILLWRGLLFNELEKRIKKFKMNDRVEIINEKTDVNKVLARAHASVVLAESSELVKAYPHSLLESLAAGKPVLTSQAIPISDYVQEYRCGEVISKINADELRQGIERLREKYHDYQKQAFIIGQRDFSLNSMLKAFEQLYGEIGAYL